MPDPTGHLRLIKTSLFVLNPCREELLGLFVFFFTSLRHATVSNRVRFICALFIFSKNVVLVTYFRLGRSDFWTLDDLFSFEIR